MDSLVDSIMRYEGGEMDDEEVVEFFQWLVNSGVVWQLQGSYGRTAKALIEAGLVRERGGRGSNASSERR